MALVYYQKDGNFYKIIIKKRPDHCICVTVTNIKMGTTYTGTFSNLIYHEKIQTLFGSLDNKRVKIQKRFNTYSINDFAVIRAHKRATQALCKQENQDVRFLGARSVDGCGWRLVSPLTGRVINILVNSGDLVVCGQPAVIIESMKMENEICVEFSGVIKTIFISKGNVVQQNEVLIEVEQKGENNGCTKDSNDQAAL